METAQENFQSIACLASLFRKGRKLTNSIPRGAMTLERIGNLIAQGFGQGRNDKYVPWIRVTRRKSSPVSNLFVAPIAIQERGLHLLSGIEYAAAHVASWLGAEEIREQFPMFPWAHAHPLVGLYPDRDRSVAPMTGLLEIAAEMDIEHGIYAGSMGVPYVATCDLVIRLGRPPVDRLVFWNCKPADLVDNEDEVRTNERIRLEAAYAHRVGARHAVFTGQEVPLALIANLDWLAPHWKEWTDAAEINRRQAFSAALNATSEDKSIRDRTRDAAAALGHSLPQAQALFRACAWSGAIDIDLRWPIAVTRRVRRADPRFKEGLKAKLLGACA